MSDPFFILAACLAAGIALGESICGPAWFWGIAYLVFLAAFLLLLVRRSSRSWFCLCLLFLAGGGFLFALPYGDLQQRTAERIELGGAKVVGRVLEMRRSYSGWVYLLDHVRIQAPEMPRKKEISGGSGSVEVFFPRRVLLHPGDLIALSGPKLRWSRFSRPRNPGQPDRAMLARSQGLTAQIYAGKDARIAILSRRIFTPWENLLHGVRDRWSRALETPTDSAAWGCSQATLLLKGMVLGERGAIDRNIQENFLRTNTFHILAISGQQMTLIFLILFGILRAVGISQKMAALICIPAMVVYGSVVGWHASVARSVIMVVLVLVGLAFDRKVRVLRFLGIAALALLLPGPAQLFDIGFQLSFLVVLFLVVFTRPLIRWETKWLALRQGPPERSRRAQGERGLRYSGILIKGLLPLIVVSLIAWIATAPLTAYRFGLFSPVTLLANLLIVSWVSVLTIPLGFISLVFGSIWIGFSYPLNAVNQIATNALIALTGWLAKIPYGSFNVAAPSQWSLFFYYCIFGVLAWMVEQPERTPGSRKRFRLALMTLAMLAILSQVLYSGRLECVVFDVGQGDAIFVRFPNGKTMLVDGGPGGFGRHFEKTVASYMQSIGASRIDRVVMSHPHADHIGGIPNILDTVQVGELVGNGRAFPSLVYRRLLLAAEKKKISLRVVQAPESWMKEGDASTRVLSPQKSDVTGFSKNENEHSIVLAMHHGPGRLLLAGDVETKAEARLAEMPELIRSDILKVAHHGGATSCTAKFLDGVKARWAIISVGRDNKFGHPSPGALSRLRERGMKIFRTDEDGAVILRSYGWFWTLRTIASRRWGFMFL